MERRLMAIADGIMSAHAAARTRFIAGAAALARVNNERRSHLYLKKQFVGWKSNSGIIKH